jgi:hypothetical protein
VDVVMFSRQDFLSLMHSHTQIRAVVEKEAGSMLHVDGHSHEV